MITCRSKLVVLPAALVLLLSIIAVRLSRRLGMPSLLLYLGIGLVLGVDTFGIDLDNTLLTEHLGFVALVFILADSRDAQ